MVRWEIGVPTYCYEAAALKPGRKNLAVCRAGEYEALPQRLGMADGADFGDRPFDEAAARTGATAVGARDFLIAVNFNLNTTSTRRANAIAFDKRSHIRRYRASAGSGRLRRSFLGKATQGHADKLPDTSATPLHVAFEEVSRAARERGIRVTGTEIVGLVPKKALVSLLGIIRKFFPALVPTGLVRGQIGHHSTQGGTKRSHGREWQSGIGK